MQVKKWPAKWRPFIFSFLFYNSPSFSYNSFVFLIWYLNVKAIVPNTALLWAAMDAALSQGPLLWRHNDMAVIVLQNTRGAPARRSWAVNRLIICWIAICCIVLWNDSIYKVGRKSRLYTLLDIFNKCSGLRPLDTLWNCRLDWCSRLNNSLLNRIICDFKASLL